MTTHEDIAAPYKARIHDIPEEDIRSIMANNDKLYSAKTGFEVDGKEQAIPVRVTSGLGGTALSDRNIARLSPATDEPGRVDIRLHNATMAADLEDANIFTLGNPGVEDPRLSVMEPGQLNKLTDSQAKEVKKGNFDQVGLAIARALKESLDREGVAHLDTYLEASSLAGSIAADAITHLIEAGVNLKGVAILDAPGLEKERGYRRIGQFISVNNSSAAYLDANHPLRQELAENAGATNPFTQTVPWARRSLRSRSANIDYGYHAMANANAQDAILRQAETMKSNDITLDVYAAGESEFNTAAASEETVRLLQEQGVNARYKRVDGASHAMTMMAGMSGEVADNLRK